ncbi:MAG TPA: DUF2254 domain-containing protein [Thermoanaerobaculia bacterium]|nr:DUF2254 domain-containing protein [Thermoanaerobaculia bacterium]
MKRTLQRLWLSLRSSLWFVPSLIVVGGIILAISMSELDKRFDGDLASRLPRVFGAGAEGSRALLGAIATSMMTIMGVTFSITIVALSLASTQFTPRIVRNFMRNRTTQFVMGAFSSVFVYCLIVLRTIQGGDEEFVPDMSILFGIILALASVWVLILFIHHMASSIQASTVISDAAEETIETIRKLFPERMNEEDDEKPQLDGGPWYPVAASSTGYIQLIDEEALTKLAKEQDAVFRVERSSGDFVVKDSPVLSVQAAGPPNETICKEVRSAFGIGNFRTVDQDAAFGVRQLVDIAMKALSPSLNDSTTAVNCVDYLGAILAELAPRRIRSREDAGTGAGSRLIFKGTTFEDFVDTAFNQIRESAEGNAAVLIRMLRSIEVISTYTTIARRRRVLARHVDMIEETAQRTMMPAYARQQVMDRVQAAKASLAAA